MKPLSLSIAAVVLYFGVLGMAFVGNDAAAIWALVLAVPVGLAAYFCIERLVESH